MVNKIIRENARKSKEKKMMNKDEWIAAMPLEQIKKLHELGKDGIAVISNWLFGDLFGETYYR